MGWSFRQGATFESVCRDLTHSFENDAIRAVCLSHTFRGEGASAGILWSAWEITHKDGTPSERVIMCDLVERREIGWGFKRMEERMEPCYYTCPLKYLDMVPETCACWRASVRQYHSSKRAA